MLLFSGAVEPLVCALPLPPLNPVGLDPLLDPAVPLPGLRLVGFDPLLDPLGAGGVALPAGWAFAGAIPGVMYPGVPALP